MLDRNFGLRLSHSTPKFPIYRSPEFWPSSGNSNAQTFLCITFPYQQFKEIGKLLEEHHGVAHWINSTNMVQNIPFEFSGRQLKYIHVYSFDSEIPTTFHEELHCVAQRSCYPKNEPWFSVKRLNSAAGRIFTSFAKYTRLGDGEWWH